MKAALLAVMLLALPAQAETVLNRGIGGEPDTLDPALAGSYVEQAVLADLMEGLTTLDAAGRPIPGIAARWDVTPDGLTWIFHLRVADWSDGTAVTAADFLAGWRRLLDPGTASRPADLLWVIKGAHGVSGGAAPSTLGVTAPNPRTLVVRLVHPAPYLLQLLALPCAAPFRKAGVTDGAYLLKMWVPNDHITLIRNPRFHNAASVRIDTVNDFPTADAAAALRRLRAGELDMQTPVPGTQLDWLRANMPGALHILPSRALAYIAFNLKDTALTDARVRRALALAYDREAVTQKVLKLGERAAYSYVPPNTANYANGPQLDFKPMPYPARLAKARQLMQDAGYGPFNRLHLDYAVGGNPDSRRLAAVFQAMARQVYVDVRIATADYQVTLRALRQGQYQLGYTNWLADYDDAGNFLDLLRSGAANNYAGYRDARFDAALDAAQAQPDPAKRAAILQAAEKIALAALPWLPVRFQSQSQAVGPRVGGYQGNPSNLNPSRWLWMK